MAEASDAALAKAAHPGRLQCVGPDQRLCGQGGPVQDGHAGAIPGAPVRAAAALRGPRVL